LAIETVLADPALRTGDLGGGADTVTCGKAVADALLAASNPTASRRTS
jgi:tartrate dehydrogenase/decarboxylase/D-malate dehydrogenase